MNNIRLENFRKIKDSWNLDLAPITFFTGKNNSGKSTVLKSLLVLEDYINSNNHFEINFNGSLYPKHKIENYDNALNFQKNSKGEKEIIFEYKNGNYSIKLCFSPVDTKSISNKGLLKNLEIIDEKGAVFSIDYISNDRYNISIHEDFLNDEIKTKKERTDFDDALRLTLQLDLQNKIIELQKVEIDFSKEDTDGGIDENKSSIRARIISLKQEIKDTQEKIKVLERKINVSRLRTKIIYRPSIELNKIDPSDKRIDKIIRKVLPQYIIDNPENKSQKNKFKTSDYRLEADRLDYVLTKIEKAIFFSVSHLSPQRSNQSRVYINDDSLVDIALLLKQHSLQKIDKKDEAFVFLQKWMNRENFDIGEDFRITHIENTIAIVEVLEEGNWLNISDKGYGASQVFSILLNIALRINSKERNPIILIEEPEANLHPSLQSKLAEMFLEVSKKYEIQFIIETHSEYLLRKSQTLFTTKEDNPFAVYYFDNESPYRLNYNDDGSFDKNFGEGFLDVVDDIALEMFIKNNGAL